MGGANRHKRSVAGLSAAADSLLKLDEFEWPLAASTGATMATATSERLKDS